MAVSRNVHGTLMTLSSGGVTKGNGDSQREECEQEINFLGYWQKSVTK